MPPKPPQDYREEFYQALLRRGKSFKAHGGFDLIECPRPAAQMGFAFSKSSYVFIVVVHSDGLLECCVRRRRKPKPGLVIARFSCECVPPADAIAAVQATLMVVFLVGHSEATRFSDELRKELVSIWNRFGAFAVEWA